MTMTQHIVGPDEGMPDWICIYLIDLPPGRGQEALDKCLDIEKLVFFFFLLSKNLFWRKGKPS